MVSLFKIIELLTLKIIQHIFLTLHQIVLYECSKFSTSIGPVYVDQDGESISTQSEAGTGKFCF